MSFGRRSPAVRGGPFKLEHPSLEALIEAEDLGFEILHPGGAGMTRELATLTAITPGTRVLEVAAGTGEAARLLVVEFGARVTTVDISPRMIVRQCQKLFSHRSDVQIVQADAHQLPFRNDSFDIALSECAVCRFDKPGSVGEMARVVRPGGRVGIHDLCWKEGAPDSLKRRLLDIEGEEPETIDGWIRVFEGARLSEVLAFDRSHLMAAWLRDARRALGLVGYLTTALRVLKRWGIGGLRTVLESERIFASPYLGYTLVVGVKR